MERKRRHSVDLSPDEAWRLSLTSYARVMSDGRWRPYRHLVYASRIVQSAITSGGGRIIINMPPRHGKSRLFSQWLPAWCLEWRPDMQIIVSSYEATLAQAFGRKARNLFRDDPRCWTRLSDSKQAENRWETPEGGGLLAAGVGGGFTGWGGDLVLVDDPHKNWEEANSPVFQRKVADWFDSTLLTRVQSSKSTVIVIMTRWCVGDLCGYLTTDDKHKGRWTVIRFPALAETEDPLGRTPGEALCPERYDARTLSDFRTSLGSHKFEGIYQQNPYDPEGEIFKGAWFRFYRETPERFDDQVISWDMNVKDTRAGSYACGQVWERVGATYFLLDEVRERASYSRLKTIFRAFCAKWSSVQAKIIEAKANGPAIESDLRSEIPGILLLEPSGSKVARAQAVTPFFEAGNVLVPDPAIWRDTHDCVQEFVRFRGAPGETNDRVDTASQAILWLSKRSRKRNTADIAAALGGMTRPSEWKV